MMWGYTYGPYPGPGAFLSILSWVVLIIVIVWIVRWAFGWHRRGPWMMGGPYHHPWMHNSALDVLKERYAKGEITKAEFDEKKKDIES
ncbi:MAG TPA: SHOCT domain-containing protein [Candidatus Paceibacterota bacterium]|nr:SHOCT domain-containing protein [Candidatus Paceibacterota bacterium]